MEYIYKKSAFVRFLSAFSLHNYTSSLPTFLQYPRTYTNAHKEEKNFLVDLKAPKKSLPDI